VGQTVILALVTLGQLFVSIEKHVWALALSAPVMWLFFGFLVYIGLRYRIFWTDEEVCQEASGAPRVCIMYGQITTVTSEISKPSELFAASRPFRRIVISTENSRGEGKFIDVSLKHFAADDIRKLMRTIRERRPDLELPKQWT
jgi:hypothetical protein